ncbi:hypothetical protein Ct9H90mP29_12320 [bacterium]|nr:MAG: hypothetical protein Ct9H90mP29_12320 [bacterium]
MVTRLTHAAITGYEDDIRHLMTEKLLPVQNTLLGWWHRLGDRITQEGMHTYKMIGKYHISEEELRRVHLPPYLEALNAGVKTL